MSNESMWQTYKLRAETAEARADALAEALEGVIRMADRRTDEFDAARAALTAWRRR